MCKNSILLWIAIVLIAAHGVGGQTLIRGVVRDEDTGEGLTGATVEVKGTDKGVVAGEEGRFVLNATELPVAIEVRHVGYDPRELEILVPGKRELEIRLEPVVYEMEGVVVLDPAVRIMREVIRSKRAWWRELDSYAAEVYARQTLYRNTDLVAVRESVARLYSSRKRGMREVVKVKRHTPNVPPELQTFAASEYAVDLYGDWVEIMGQKIMGMTHPRALRNYAFELTEEEGEEGARRFTIAVAPGQELGRGFTGYVTVNEKTYSLVEARLRVTPPVQSEAFPSEQGIEIFYHQEFGHFPPGAYLPTVLHYEIDARFGTSALGEDIKRLRGVPTPRSRLQGLTLWQGQRTGVELPELFFADGERLQVEEGADWRVELLEDHWETAPLSLREESAFGRLKRNPLPLGEAEILFALYRKRVVRREMAAHEIDPLAEGSPVTDQVISSVVGTATGIDVEEVAQSRFVPALGYEMWFNRVDGTHAGLRAKSRLGASAGLFAKGGYNERSDKWFYGAGLRQGWGTEQHGFVGLNFQTNTRPRYASESYSLALNSLPVLLSLDDYFDYYRSRRWNAETGYRFARTGSNLRVGFTQEKAHSLSKRTDFDLVCGFQIESGRFYEWFCKDRDEPHPQNPAVDEGRVRALELLFDWGGPYRPFGRREQRRAELIVEHSGDWLGSDFAYTRYRLSADWYTGWPVRKAGLGEGVHLHLLAGTAAGDLPVQRYGALDAGLWIFRPFGTFRTLSGRPYEGERYGALFWEVDLGTRLFERLRLNGVARRGLELVVQGASGRTWIGRERMAELGYSPRYAEEFHHETGLSLVLPPLRLELTRRLDRNDWAIGFSLARTVER